MNWKERLIKNCGAGRTLKPGAPLTDEEARSAVAEAIRQGTLKPRGPGWAAYSEESKIIKIPSGKAALAVGAHL